MNAKADQIKAAGANPLRQVHQLGQSIWLDDIRRGWLRDGRLAKLIADDALAGVTSNPAIFAKSISEGAEYNEAIASLAAAGRSINDIYETLALEDVQAAADLFRATYDASGGTDGFVSLEVSPHLADDTQGTVAEGLRLWQAFDRPNAMIKVPGTEAGLPAITELIAAGVNINVTLLFSVERYRAVVDAYMAGLEKRSRAGKPIDQIASVASFFLSRIDTLVDAQLDKMSAPEAKAQRGRAAIANARLAYQYFKEWTHGDRWRVLAYKGVKPQRLLWASTSSKDPAYKDTMYVEALIAPNTVNTLPPATVDAYRDHGSPAVRIEEDLSSAAETVQSLRGLGIDLNSVSAQLEREGVKKFKEPFDALLATLAARAKK
ncbi:transaldolase [Steroidobacter sp. S1-65]|uniref:Transaldolase n=1 Tax=Steroidobacter gossypii TaxID=2805490 RepID=A0ABS1WRR7_9GAMM|nr:transaldolase [Steroidobacter gossypii]MBM0103669.1 transaldolase [Steroidobacter gossypii]